MGREGRLGTGSCSNTLFKVTHYIIARVNGAHVVSPVKASCVLRGPTEGGM